MNKLLSTVALVVLALVALGALAPRMTQLLGALSAFVLVVAISAAVLRLVWFYTRRW